jgi:hypothetical protein
MAQPYLTLTIAPVHGLGYEVGAGPTTSYLLVRAFGQPGTPVLFAAGDLLSPPFPGPLGTLVLSPPSLLPFGTATVGTGNVGTLIVPFPSSLVLPEPLWLQALYMPAAGLPQITNPIALIRR